LPVAQDFIFTAHDLFSVFKSNHSARSYARLAAALERLQGTLALKAAKVRLCDRLFRAIFRDRRMLEYAATYLQSGRIERRI
jgi:hypothetical protein